MLKFLTHKLRTHSINEDNFVEKADEDHDSGTESDDEIDTVELPTLAAMSDRCSISPADTGCSMGSPVAQDLLLHDPHSSEEELEVINKHNNRGDLEHLSACPIRSTSVCLPEKRKWTQMSDSRSLDFNSENEETMESLSTNLGDLGHPGNLGHSGNPGHPGNLGNLSNLGNLGNLENLENMSHFSNLSSRSMDTISPCSPFHSVKSQFDGNSPVVLEVSSDDEVPNLLESMATPVQFRTSPPLEAFKPGRPNKGRSLSPPHKVIHYEVSPRKRSRHMRHSHVQRPCLDFEKMQQLKARSVTAWRNGGDHGGELSVFCW